MKLNLARAWRSSHFDQIVGQDLAVRILKNSLFLDQYFPVYLFAGQRGCGKTSMARLFAASLNCEKLSVFQAKPRDVLLPCQECSSCRAMKEGKHPDYIEIDAASHTGVDNVRQIIDAASLLPVFGRKKIYLIDEAHMLSKAAFNAFLKILEEPPMSVIFILATTDMYKIIDTVRSRSFQIFFKPVAPSAVADHLEQICAQEKISYHRNGLDVIARQTEGSVRDAINLLEQVRFSTDCVDEKAALTVLGYVSDEQMITLFGHVADGSPEHILRFVQTLPFQNYNPVIVWQQFSLLVRAVLWTSYRLEPTAYQAHQATLSQYAQRVSQERLVKMLQVMYQHELPFLKTAKQHDMFEMILLLMCNQQGSTLTPVASKQQAAPAPQVHHEAVASPRTHEPTLSSLTPSAPPIQHTNTQSHSPWQQVIQGLNEQKNFLMQSVFNQMKFKEHNQETHQIRVTLGQQYAFFKDLLDAHQADWQPLIQNVFGAQAQLHVEIDTADVAAPRAVQQRAEKEVVRTSGHSSAAPRSSAQTSYQAGPKQSAASHKEKVVDVTAGTLSKNTEMLLSVLPGSLIEITSSEVKDG